MTVDIDPETLESARQRRHAIHAHPEIGYDVARTADLAAGELQRLGLEVVRGVGRSGVVGVLRGRPP